MVGSIDFLSTYSCTLLHFFKTVIPETAGEENMISVVSTFEVSFDTDSTKTSRNV